MHHIYLYRSQHTWKQKHQQIDSFNKIFALFIKFQESHLHISFLAKMTSTDIFTGISDTRNSSRVLRPPGGGYTNILAFPTEPEEPTACETVAKDSSKQNITSTETPESKESHEKETATENEGVKVEVKKEPKPTPRRTRIPPGGYSSGLW